MSELDLFRRVAGDNPLRQWLEGEKAKAVAVLAASPDHALVLRAQGAYQLAEKQLQLLEKAKDLR